MKENDFPSTARGGVELGQINVQNYIRRYAEQNKEWHYAPIVARWYPRVEEFKRRFFDGVFKPWDLSRLPSPPIAIEDMRNYKYLGSYHLVPDGYGLSDKLTLNEKHFKLVDGVWIWDYGGEWGLGETIVHEMAHEKHKHKGPTKPAHDKYFRGLLEELGIYCNEYGQHYRQADPDKPFGILMKEWSIQRQDLPEVNGNQKGSWWSIGEVRKGKSSLDKYSCGCQNARIGAKEFHAVCTICGNPFIKVEIVATAVLGIAEPSQKHSQKPEEMSDQASEELDKEFERRRDWNAIYKDLYGPYPGSEPDTFEPDFKD